METIQDTERFQLLAQSVSTGFITAPEAAKLYNNPDFAQDTPDEADETVSEKELSDYFWDFLSGTGDVLWHLAQSQLAEWLLASLLPVGGKMAHKIIKNVRRIVK